MTRTEERVDRWHSAQAVRSSEARGHRRLPSITVGAVIAALVVIMAAVTPVGATTGAQPLLRPAETIGGSLPLTAPAETTLSPESTLSPHLTNLTLPTRVTLPTLGVPGHASFGGSPVLPDGGGASPSTWSVQPSPNVLAKHGLLASDSCSSTSACTAVGDYTDTSGIVVTLAERWNGVSWSVQATPNPSGAKASAFAGVSCSSSSACTAVGEYINSSSVPVSLAEAWNGTSWSVLATVDPSGAQDSILDGVSCSSASKCTAVGGYVDSSGVTLPLAEARKGSTWSMDATATPSGSTESTFNSVACTATNVCTAAGDAENSSGVVATLVEVWNGTSWSVQPTPDVSGSPQNFLYGVSCSSASACTAVGGYAQNSGLAAALSEEWNGTSWSIQATPEPTGAVAALFYGVACTPAGPCAAVGAYNGGSNVILTLADEWNGATWSLQTTPDPSGALTSSLAGVACPTTDSCTAVGHSVNKKGVGVTLAEARNGSSWSIQVTPDVSGAQNTVLQGVACTAATACAAVGYSVKDSGVATTVAQVWNGSAWSVQKLPKIPSAENSVLAAVSCTTANRCTAVGQSADSSGVAVPLAEEWDGSSWSVQVTPNPSGEVESMLNGVSCTSAKACTAVGVSFNSSGLESTLAEIWNGTTWSLVATPEPSGAQAGSFAGVSCAAGACTAVGESTDSSGVENTLAETWNGTSWSIEVTPNPSGAQESGLNGVSCTSANACTAVGAYFDGSGPNPALAEMWDGSSWSLQSTPLPPGAQNSTLSGVSCTSADACTAVGVYGDSSGVTETLAEVWNGTAWSLQTTPNPSGSQLSTLSGVACTSTNGCSAVGHYVPASTYLTLVEIGPSP